MTSETGSVLQLPIDVVQPSYGFAIDIGGSVAKIAYRIKQDPKTKSEKLGKLGLHTFKRDDISGIAEFIHKHCDINSAVPATVCVTGVGCNFFKKDLEAKLHVELKVVVEFECFVKAARYLHKFGAESLFYPLPREGVQDGEKCSKLSEQTTGVVKELAGKSAEVELTDEGEEKDIFPCLLTMCGSGFAHMTVDKDGAFSMVEGALKGGRTFLGLASRMIGVNDFDTIIDMACRGDRTKIDTMCQDLKSQGFTDIYSNLPDETPIFVFGKAHTGKDYRPEDVAASLVALWCNELAQLATIVAAVHHLNRIYFCGNFVNNELVRTHLTKELITRTKFNNAYASIDFQFLRYGGHLGALGAYIKEYL